LYSGDSESPFSFDPVNIYPFYGFSERSLVTLFKEDYRPDGMIQCGAESNLISVVSAARLRCHERAHAVQERLIEVQTYRPTDLARLPPSRHYPHSSKYSRRLQRSRLRKMGPGPGWNRFGANA
jgi:hypothetical protein